METNLQENKPFVPSLQPVCSFEEALDTVNKIIENSDERLPIDEKIKSLVAAFNMFGIKTFQSCEGHAPPKSCYHPYIQVEPSYLAEAIELVLYQNRLDRPDDEMHDNQWVIHPTRDTLNIQPQHLKDKLDVLQKNANQFAETLKALAATYK